MRSGGLPGLFAFRRGAEMGRLAIFIDGGYVDRIAMDSFNVRPDFQQFSKTITSIVDNNVGEPVDLL